MKITQIFLALAMLCTLPAFALTDEQVINYIKTQAAKGKSEQQIGKELLAKGVTPEQVKRIKAKYDRENSDKNISTGDGSAAIGASRMRNSSDNKNLRGSSSSDNNENSRYSRNTRNSNRNVRSSASGGLSSRQVAIDETVILEDNEYNPDDIYQFDLEQSGDAKMIYGHSLFNERNLSFEPNANMATPENYRLGPGDEVIIDIWGASEDHVRQTITPEGSIMISQLGPISLNGLTINEANKLIRGVFSKKYAGVGEETDIKVTLGDIRSIQVDVMGEVSTPGTFRLSPFSNVFHALYNAGGINDIGSMRNIHVMRNGRRIANVDIYDYLFKGKQTGNIRLQEGDVIIVPAYSELINITGNVKRPMYYELKPSETVSDLLEFAGGFSGDAYSEMVKLERQNGLENELVNVDKAQFNSYRLKDGDIVTVGTVIDRFSNRAELKGAVNRPGTYAIGKDINTLRDLIAKADGLAEDAYKGRAVIYREGPDLTMQVVAVNLGEVMAGRQPDIKLERNDIVEISSVKEIFERGDFTISGPVAFPGQYSYAKGTTISDLILRAGGLLEGASRARIDVSRRIVDPEATHATNQIAKIYTFSLENGLTKGKAAEFILEPYDVVEVRKSPTYIPQGLVEIDGEVVFRGEYTLSKRNERLSELVERAGGTMDGAYLKGAYLTRKMTEDEMATRKEAMRLAMMNANTESGDSISSAKLDLSDRYNVGIDLVAALENPGTTYDLVLKPGDKLFIPELQSTVKISGDVMFPNTVIYQPGEKVKYYINQAGGYGERAKKSKAFVIYMNGSVAKVGRKTVIEPGCHIIVPSKQPSNSEVWTKILSYATSFGSLATMVATIGNLLK